MLENRRDLDSEQQAKLWDIPPADWVLEMQDHYRRTGWYRPEDLRRLLGDPTRYAGWSTEKSFARLDAMDRDERG